VSLGRGRQAQEKNNLCWNCKKTTVLGKEKGRRRGDRDRGASTDVYLKLSLGERTTLLNSYVGLVRGWGHEKSLRVTW